MKKLGFLLTILCLCLISCTIDPNFNVSDDVTHEGSSDWMSLIGDSEKLANLSIPGTHDSGANYDFYSLSSTAAAQDMTIREQLEAGVRFFDIRPCMKNGELRIMHGPSDQHKTLDDVLNTYIDFLDNHPGEVILMSTQPEEDDEGDFRNIYNYFIDLQKTSKTDYFIFAKDISGLTMAECRKKIIILSRNTYQCKDKYFDMFEKVFNSGYLEYGVKYATTDVDATWDSFLNMIGNRDGSDNSYLYAIFLSCYYEGQFGIPNIRIMSSVLDERLKTYLENLEPEHMRLGVIACDHITKNLAYLIYSRN